MTMAYERHLYRFFLTTTDQASMQPGGGTGGRVARSRGTILDYVCGIDRLPLQRLPPGVFFGYFLVRTQESNTYCILSV